MSKFSQFSQSVPELFIVCNKGGDYLDYFGGADKERFSQDLEG